MTTAAELVEALQMFVEADPKVEVYLSSHRRMMLHVELRSGEIFEKHRKRLEELGWSDEGPDWEVHID